MRGFISEQEWATRLAGELRRSACKCQCHQDGTDVVQGHPCCQLYGEKYLNANGSIDIDRLEALWRSQEFEQKKSNRA
jgi:hypothetical protein